MNKNHCLIILLSLTASAKPEAASWRSLFQNTVEVKVSIPAALVGIKDSALASKQWAQNNPVATGLVASSLALTLGNILYHRYKLGYTLAQKTSNTEQKKWSIPYAKQIGIAAASTGTLLLLSYFLRNYPSLDWGWKENFTKASHSEFEKTFISFSSWIKEWVLSPATGILLSTIYSIAEMRSKMQQENNSNFSVYYSNREKAVKGFATVAGGVPEGIINLKDQIENSEKYQKMSIPLPKGFLFYGPPGTGKTLLGRALAEELDMVFISVKAPELESKWLGGSAENVRNLYAQAHAEVNQDKKVIIFIDEIDSIAPNRSMTGGGYSSQCLTQLLSEIDGLAKSKNIITIGTTNIPASIDPALLRSGRLEQHIEISLPDAAKRQAILEYYLAQRPHTLASAEIASIATLIDGASGADIEELINRAAVFTVRNGKETVSNAELQEAIQKKWPNLQLPAAPEGHLTADTNAVTLNNNDNTN